MPRAEGRGGDVRGGTEWWVWLNPGHAHLPVFSPGSKQRKETVGESIAKELADEVGTVMEGRFSWQEEVGFAVLTMQGKIIVQIPILCSGRLRPSDHIRLAQNCGRGGSLC